MLRVEDIIRCIKMDEALGRSPFGGNCADKNPPAPVLTKVHVLLHGFPLCGFSQEVPGKWPAGHLWVTTADKDKSTCPACLARTDG